MKRKLSATHVAIASAGPNLNTLRGKRHQQHPLFSIVKAPPKTKGSKLVHHVITSDFKIRGHAPVIIAAAGSESVHETTTRGGVVDRNHECPRTVAGRLVTYENLTNGMGSLKFIKHVLKQEGVTDILSCAGEQVSTVIRNRNFSFSAWQAVNVLEDHEHVWAGHLSYDRSNLILVHDKSRRIYTLVAKWQKFLNRWLIHFSEFGAGRGPNGGALLHFKNPLA